MVEDFEDNEPYRLLATTSTLSMRCDNKIEYCTIEEAFHVVVKKVNSDHSPELPELVWMKHRESQLGLVSLA